LPDEFEHQPHDRRAMFRLGLKRLMEPIAEYLEERFNLPLPEDRTVLRPPGALPERAFLDACYRCGNCMDVCPARAIKSASHQDAEQAGTPYIDPDLGACTVCAELACIKTCPSGALAPLADAGDIAMGLARIDRDLCLRSSGQPCTICRDECPRGAAAIDISDGGELEVKTDGCVGCGTCQYRCPTFPKAIKIEPL